MIVFTQPRSVFYRYLQGIVEAGFANRVMFGSDQMVWPGVIERAIETIEAAPFLERATEAGHSVQRRRTVSSFERSGNREASRALSIPS